MGVALQGINITSARAQQALRACGAISGVMALVFAIVAYCTVYQRGLGETGIQILLCIGTAGMGGFGYTQAAFMRHSVLFGIVPCEPPRTMLEPAWPLGAAALTLVLAAYIIATA
jgi:hypothetical protein